MGFFSKLLGASDAIDATGNVIEKTGAVIDEIFTSDEERLTHAEIMERLRQQPLGWQHQLNLLNAQDRSWFNSGWRPAIGWIGAFSLAMYFLPQYALASVVWGKASFDLLTAVGGLTMVKDGVTQLAFNLPAYPTAGEGLWELIALLLGGSFLRTVEKRNGTAKQ